MLKTRDIPSVELFEVGTHNGHPYSEQDLDDIVSAFTALKGDGYVPPLKLDHAEGQPVLEDVPADGGPAFGWVENLRREGGKLLGDLKRVPEKLAELMEAGAYRGRSAEIWWNLDLGEKKYRRAMKAVALLGAQMPAVRTLSDIYQLYGAKQDFASDEKGQFHTVYALSEGGQDAGLWPKFLSWLKGGRVAYNSQVLMKTEVSYRKAEDAERCSGCRWFSSYGDDPNGWCALVEGQIDPNAICDRYELPMQAFSQQGQEGKEGTMPQVTVEQYNELASKVESLSQAVTAKDGEITALRTELHSERTLRLERWATDTVANWYGEREANRTRLLAEVEKFGQDSDHVRGLIDREDAIAKQFTQSALFREVGKGGGNSAGGSAFGDLVAKYESQGKSKAEAIKLAATDSPSLYEQYRQDELAAAEATRV